MKPKRDRGSEGDSSWKTLLQRDKKWEEMTGSVLLHWLGLWKRKFYIGLFL